MKLGFIFAACMLVAGCGAAASVDSSAVPNSSSDGGTSTGSGDDSATGTTSGDDGSTLPPGNDGGVADPDSGSSGGDDGSSPPTADSGSGGGDDGGSTTADSGSGGGGNDGGAPSTDSGSGGGDDGGGSTADSGSGGGGDDGGGTTTDSGSGGNTDSGSGGGDDGGTTTTDSGSGGNTDGGSCNAPKCVLTQGYYKNHPSNWHVLPVVMGTNSYDETACLSLLSNPSVGDDSLILAKQYIAAVENGGLCDPNASALMAQAQAWFTDNQNGLLPYHTSEPVGGCASDHISVPCQAYWLGQALDSYNNGLSGTPACQ